jgi:hypothetical protein
MAISAGVTLRLLAGCASPDCAGLRRAHYQHQQIVGRQAPVLSRTFSRTFAPASGKLGLDALEVFEDAGSALGDKQRLDVVALLARKFADVRNADGNHRQIFIDGQSFQIGGAKQSLTSVKAGRRRSGLSMPYWRMASSKSMRGKGRFDFVAGGFERGGQKAFDDLPNRSGCG